MEVTEEKIRQIVAETRRHLGEHAHPDMVKKVVRAVVERLLQEKSTSGSR